jgi:hypothetical protein
LRYADTIELVESGLVGSVHRCHSSVGSWSWCPSVDVLDREIQLVFMPFTSGAATWPLAARAQPAA